MRKYSWLEGETWGYVESDADASPPFNKIMHVANLFTSVQDSHTGYPLVHLHQVDENFDSKWVYADRKSAGAATMCNSIERRVFLPSWANFSSRGPAVGLVPDTVLTTRFLFTRPAFPSCLGSICGGGRRSGDWNWYQVMRGAWLCSGDGRNGIHLVGRGATPIPMEGCHLSPEVVTSELHGYLVILGCNRICGPHQRKISSDDILFVESASWPLAVFFLLFLLAKAIRRHKKYSRLPPGPSPLPLIGNALDFPRTHLGREFAEMAKKYGDVVYLNLLGKDSVILGSLKAARDLLDKRSANYSNRPTSIMVQLVGFDWVFVVMNYGQRLRQHRRAVHPTMTPDAVAQYQSVYVDAARHLLRLLLRDPEDLGFHIKFTIATITMGAVYGIRLREPHDKYYHMIERMADIGEETLTPGRFPVEAFPMLLYLPAWFPGGGFKEWAADAKRDITANVNYLFEASRSAMTTESLAKPMIHRILEDAALEGDVEREKLCKELAVTMYVAGADTTNSLTGTFFLAMALYPQVQKKAQQELDAVVGTERLPDLSDRPSLPYVTAIVKELLRWHPPVLIGVPHCSVDDDEYNGHLIPGGTTVFANIWAILRDPEVYRQPDEFVPDRFLDTAGNLDVQGRDPADVAFGFGRRVCPGEHFAESSLFVLAASVLSAFEIGPPVDEDGIPLPVKLEASDHLIVSHPKVHKYTMNPRSALERLVEIAH